MTDEALPAAEDWALEDAEFPVPAAHPNPRGVRWGIGTAREILRRTAAGESMRAICRDAAMPAPHTVGRWAREKPMFGAALQMVRLQAGHGRPGGRSTYCEATAMAIFERVCAGESLTGVCGDADMPVIATVYKWRAERPEFGRALAAAMQLRAEHLYEEGWEMAQAITPATAYATDVKLRHLRWHVGKLAPKKYGTLKPQEPGQAQGGEPAELVHVYLKRYVARDDAAAPPSERGRWSEEPAEHVSSSIGVGKKGFRAWTPAPGPQTVREPLSCQGPNPTRALGGSRIEVEEETPGDDETLAEDFWATPEWLHGKDEDWT